VPQTLCHGIVTFGTPPEPIRFPLCGVDRFDAEIHRTDVETERQRLSRIQNGTRSVHRRSSAVIDDPEQSDPNQATAHPAPMQPLVPALITLLSVPRRRVVAL
jgi:hypothetical protein